MRMFQSQLADFQDNDGHIWAVMKASESRELLIWITRDFVCKHKFTLLSILCCRYQNKGWRGCKYTYCSTLIMLFICTVHLLKRFFSTYLKATTIFTKFYHFVQVYMSLFIVNNYNTSSCSVSHGVVFLKMFKFKEPNVSTPPTYENAILWGDCVSGLEFRILCLEIFLICFSYVVSLRKGLVGPV